MNRIIEQKVSQLPKHPGVYFFKNSKNNIIYIGKAANLNNRVRQYFHKNRLRDTKTTLLINEICTLDWQVTSGEAEALFLEAELIKRYQPKYNILLRDDKSNTFIRINSKDYSPSVTLTRNPLDDGAEYFGPYLSSWQVKKALKYLRNSFPYSIHSGILPNRACLDYHLGLCPGPETKEYNRRIYMANLQNLKSYIKGSKDTVFRFLKKEMATYSKQKRFEEAAQVRDRINNLKALQNKIIFGDSETLDISKDHALIDLKNLLELEIIPRRIEAYDVSHLQGSDTVASMVVFLNGTPMKPFYRKFKISSNINNDFASIKETIFRRFNTKNSKQWRKPDLIIIDGGISQLSAVISVLGKNNLDIPIIGLAKLKEEIIVHKSKSNIAINLEVLKKLKGLKTANGDYLTIKISTESHIIRLLQRIRDESHRFAITYHSYLRKTRQLHSIFDDMHGVGPVTRKKLISFYGSINKIKNAQVEEIAEVVGYRKAKIIKKYLSS